MRLSGILVLQLAAWLMPGIAALSAQQPNSAAALLTFDGTNGPPWPVNHVVNAAVQPAITVTLAGAPGQGYLLAETPAGLASPGTPLAGAGLLDLDLYLGAFVLMDGITFSTGTIFDWAANTAATGVSTWTIPIGSAASGFSGGFQAVVVSPASPAGLALTAATDLTIAYSVVPNGVFVSVTTGAQGNPGTPAAPLSTIEAGLAMAIASPPPRPSLFIAAGTYNLAATLNVADGISLIGGFDPVSWIQSPGSVTQIVVADATAVLAANIASTTVLDHLTIAGADGDAPGQSAVGVRAVASPGLEIRHTILIAGNGAAGQAGATPQGTANAGANGALGTPGCENGGVFCSTCGQPQGGPGGPAPWPAASGGFGGGARLGSLPGNPGQPGGGGAPGGPGTPGGAGNWSTPPTYWGANGMSGAAGTNGASASPGTYVATGYVPAAGNDGTVGTPGSGGGGGGGGGGGTVDCDSYGGGGGGGGAGGAPGSPGTGGGGGGGSFALYLHGSNVLLESCELRVGNGGAGGAGGSGQAGGQGGSGGQGPMPGTGNFYGSSAGQDDGSNGGRGGNGGNGGGGGAGSGGAGGPSWCLVNAWSSVPVLVGAIIYVTGTGGAGGAGGVSGAGQPAPAGPPGPAGTAGP